MAFAKTLPVTTESFRGGCAAARAGGFGRGEQFTEKLRLLLDGLDLPQVPAAGAAGSEPSLDGDEDFAADEKNDD